MQACINVILADDHPLVRSGIRAALHETPDIKVVAETNTTEGLVQLCQMVHPTVLVLDAIMPGPDLNQTLTTLERDYPDIKIVILSAFADGMVARTAMNQSAAGYVLKDESPELLYTAIRTVVQGATWYSHRVMTMVLQTPPPPAPPRELTERELDVLYGFSRGTRI